ncbi:MAG: hypothetical protein QXF01_02515 [Candidatus Micrarchaeaceae archaeon]
MRELYKDESADRIVVTCSDRRLSEYLDNKFNDGKTVFVRTAGADVTNISDTLTELAFKEGQGFKSGYGRHGIKQILLFTHTDMEDFSKGCGWAGRLAVEADAKLHGSRIDAKFIGDLQISQFIDLEYKTRPQIEVGNEKVQSNALEKLFGNTGVELSTGTIDTSKIVSDDRLEHVLVITRPSKARYSEMAERMNRHGSGLAKIGRYNAYYSQVNTFNEALSDARLFIGALGIRDVRILPKDPADGELMGSWAEKLKLQNFAGRAKITLC